MGKTLDKTVNVLLAVGALNWGLAIWDVNFISMIGIDWLATAIYAAIGLSGVSALVKLFK